MLTLKKISKPELIKAVAKAYEHDQELFDKYHIQKTNFPGATLATMAMIRDTAAERKCDFYKAVYKKEMIGYVVSFDGFLYSYGINIKYRTKFILPKYWEAIKGVMPKRFFSMLYENNTRAENWLKKCGMKEIERVDNTISFIYE